MRQHTYLDLSWLLGQSGAPSARVRGCILAERATQDAGEVTDDSKNHSKQEHSPVAC